ncbi:MAG TPA: monovalent cation:proton antiporter-2 (CPA2) family protein, partial [Alphaproteobacteria bacterium]|nr:monovalent cation:proton antiporter-2 (CPA2) family protein [Alphaproteobacteria bacterium]
MYDTTLLQIAVFLTAAVFAAPLARKLGIGSVLGYLAAGVLVGPYGLGFIYSVYQVGSILHFAEFGVVLLLFIIGLEIRPKRLWTMRNSVFGVGALQFLLTSAALAGLGSWLGLAAPTALLLGFTLSMSSTAFALQVLEETGELTARHGRTAFSVLLFQDLAAIPLIALVPIFAVGGPETQSMNLLGAVKALALIAVVVVGGRLILHKVFPIIARAKVREAMTAAALLTVIAAAILMELGGLSAGLGAFIAGALLADSDYRHELEADIAPFEGLLLGLFFTAIGMSLDLSLLLSQPLLIAGLVAALIVVKSMVLFGIGQGIRLGGRPSRRFALSLSQGGEFAFVILAAAASGKVIPQEISNTLTVVVTLSMVATPLLLRLESVLFRPVAEEPQYGVMPDESGFVVIAGFGRFGQIVGRMLHAKGFSFTALDISSEQVDFVGRFGHKIYYGDATRLDILHAAKTGEARAFVLAIDDVEASLKAAALVRRNFPDLPIFARARNRPHAHRLMQLGVPLIRRETLDSALALTGEVLVSLGLNGAEARSAVEIFKEHDIRRLQEDFEHYQDIEKLRENAAHYAA